MHKANRLSAAHDKGHRSSAECHYRESQVFRVGLVKAAQSEMREKSQPHNSHFVIAQRLFIPRCMFASLCSLSRRKNLVALMNFYSREIHMDHVSCARSRCGASQISIRRKKKTMRCNWIEKLSVGGIEIRKKRQTRWSRKKTIENNEERCGGLNRSPALCHTQFRRHCKMYSSLAHDPENGEWNCLSVHEITDGMCGRSEEN